MARIVGGSMIGELSGKLGGNVFARNKSGAYIRQYVIPVDPNTQAQANARASFGVASSSYHSLSDTQKSQWQNFASNIYLPKNGANSGQFSGFNAFTSLNNVLVNAQRLFVSTPVVKVNGVTNAITDYTNFATTQTAPNLTIQANLALQGGGFVPLQSANSLEVYTDGTFDITFQLGATTVPVPYNITNQIQDANGNLLGFTLFMSNPVQQPNMFIANPELYNLGYIGNFTLATGTGTGAEIISIEGKAITPDTYQSFPQENDWVRLSLYAVSTSGQLIRLFSETQQVQAP